MTPEKFLFYDRDHLKNALNAPNAQPAPAAHRSLHQEPKKESWSRDFEPYFDARAQIKTLLANEVGLNGRSFFDLSLAHRIVAGGSAEKDFTERELLAKYPGTKDLGDLKQRLEQELADKGLEVVGARAMKALVGIARLELRGIWVNQPALETALQNPELKNSWLFLQAVKEAINPQTGRVHASYTLYRQKTGRMTCRKPHLHSIPEDPRIRSIFQPEEHGKYIISDIKQAHPRILAQYTGCKNLIQRLTPDCDIHAESAAIVLSKPVQKVTAEERQTGKTLNSSLPLGVGPGEIVERVRENHGLIWTLDQARGFRNRWFSEFPECIGQAEIGLPIPQTFVGRSPHRVPS